MTDLLNDSTLSILTFADSGKLAIGGSHNGTLQIWNLQNTPPTTSKNHLHTSPITSLSYSPCGGFIASADNTGNVGLWSSEELIEPMTVLDDITSRVATLYPLSDSSHLLTTHKDGSIKLWNVLTNELEREFKGHLSEVQSLSVTNNEELLMSGDLDGHVIIWSLQKGTKLRNFKDHSTQIISVFFHCSLYIVTADREGVIFIKEYKTANVLYNYAIYKSELSYLKVERIDNCDIIAAGYGNGIIKVWKLPNMESMTTLQGHTGPITSIHFYSCTKTGVIGCLTTSKDGSIFMWDVTSGCQISRLITDHPITAGSLNPSSQLNTLTYGCDNGYIGMVWYECKLHDEKGINDNIILKLLKSPVTPVYNKTKYSPIDFATSTTVPSEEYQDIKSQDLTVPSTPQTESIKEEEMSDVKEREDRPAIKVRSSCPIKESNTTNSSSSLTKQSTTFKSPVKDSTVNNICVVNSNNNSTELNTYEPDSSVSNEKENQKIVIENEEPSINLTKDGINISVGTTSRLVAEGSDSRSTACTFL